ncbi:MAG TPA: hypothetical protein VGP47_07150 [Parachlamydiaceae bacterium]|nr:hypothetical protein [Parachlamydiaceae bacterium]
MINVLSFVKESVLSAYAYHMANIKQSGAYIFRMIKNCLITEKTDAAYKNFIDSSPSKADSRIDLSKDCWWTKISNTKEFDAFKTNWKDLAKTEAAREKEAQKLQSLYNSSAHVGRTNQCSYDAPLGTVWGIPGNFSLWMSGVALVAAYLSEKKKIEGLFVCETLESLSSQLNKIIKNPSNQRYAFILGGFQSGFKQMFPVGFQPNFPQHKVSVCVEKKDGQLTIALLDAQPVPGINQDILPPNLSHKIWSGYEQYNRFNCQELVFRAILKSFRDSKCPARLLQSHVLRQVSYGCEVFALQDSMAFLRDLDFFNKITCSSDKTIKIDQQYEIEVIKTLPSEFMVGMQSSKFIDKFRKQGGEFDKTLLGKKRTLQQYLKDHQFEVTARYGQKQIQNHYITKKSFKYLNLASISTKYLHPSDIDKITSKVFIKAEC